VEKVTISDLAMTRQRPGSSEPRLTRVLVVACFSVAAAIPVAAQGLDEARQQFLASCGVCHTTEKEAPHRQGPNLFGVFGRKAAQTPNFKFSEALAKANLVWDEPTLERWIEDAAAMQPGTIMPYRQRDPEKRKLIMQYLKTLTP
jgi:cytochrome c